MTSYTRDVSALAKLTGLAESEVIGTTFADFLGIIGALEALPGKQGRAVLANERRAMLDRFTPTGKSRAESDADIIAAIRFNAKTGGYSNAA